jgi:signal transduction histidine kinase
MRYSNEVEQMLYLICREACENARKHAQTSAVTIDGWFTADEVELVVSDSGKGFDPKYFEDSERFGLKAQNAFALAIGAQILYRGREEGGTEVVIRWSSGKRVENS